MKIKNSIFIAFFALLVFTTACKSSRNVTSNQDLLQYTSDKRYNAVVQQYKEWSTISANGKVSISMSTSFGSPAQLRMIKGKSISVSLRPIFGVEMARIFLNSDSIYIIDKFHKMYLAEKITDLTNGFPIEINAMQNIIINRAFLLDKGELSQKTQKSVSIVNDKDTTSWEIHPKNPISDFIYSFTFNNKNELTTFNVNSQRISIPFSLKYSDFNNSEIGNIATSINFQTVIKSKVLTLDVSIDASRVRLNTDFDDKIEINPSYKRIPASAIPLILNNL